MTTTIKQIKSAQGGEFGRWLQDRLDLIQADYERGGGRLADGSAGLAIARELQRAGFRLGIHRDTQIWYVQR